MDETTGQTFGGSVSIVGTQGFLYDQPAGGTQSYYRVAGE